MLEKIIYPECYCCKKVVKRIKFGLCEECLGSLTKVEFESRCKYCSFPLPSGSNICGRCFKEKREFDGGFFLFPYNDCGKALIHSIKFKDKIEYLKILESFNLQIHEFLQDKEIEVLTYVPSSIYHYLKRGYSVPREIGKILSSSLGIPLKKLVFTRKPFKKLLSSTKTASERRKIVKSFFRVRSKHQYKSLLLVDDVFTTGATVNRISKLLKREEIAEKVYFLTLAMVIDR
ncbi:phosphoribosyltransferace [Thermotomaculum hydrothermale]|uniref:Phosphoribosyltransferace n=1 Tax=Thermotomaculum hydrothermale TaxID=981385 RepID=A0A7R6PUN1_9BACT|nr:ComF family protein [Thermotomaculum hydrothermale]BBB32997.1 phosphoribosyltransferace [Thermotomaculum hydrothermale]